MPADSKISKIQELAYEIRVGDVMKRNVITVSPQTPMSELRKILRKKRVSGTPVVGQEKLVGIISLEDFIRWLNEHEPDCPVEQKMTRDVQTLYPDELLIHAVNRFEKFGFGRFPVIDRESREVRGIVTRGAIVEGLLKKLEIDHYEEEEVYRHRIRNFFGDIFADRIALFFQYDVAGHDFNRAGESASRLKRTLRRLGVDPEVVRRAAIATYEAEMNLIIYTDGGKIRVRVEPHEILVRVDDSGPGIPDIEKALQPGYSTAPEWVRELGFGAGMGLDNIRKCASKMGLRSIVGKGTRLRINISIDDEVASETN
ncbi:MAG: CBS domain-containing protein [Phycisphaerales bacterium]|nr:MAG: CBS domain-containing protein [Phycisphaerales bacterium]UCF16609.1 MAG: CBS domain-containing protein [Phycisphaerales bacterium]